MLPSTYPFPLHARVNKKCPYSLPHRPLATGEAVPGSVDSAAGGGATAVLDDGWLYSTADAWLPSEVLSIGGVGGGDGI